MGCVSDRSGVVMFSCPGFYPHYRCSNLARHSGYCKTHYTQKQKQERAMTKNGYQPVVGSGPAPKEGPIASTNVKPPDSPARGFVAIKKARATFHCHIPDTGWAGIQCFE